MPKRNKITGKKVLSATNWAYVKAIYDVFNGQIIDFHKSLSLPEHKKNVGYIPKLSTLYTYTMNNFEEVLADDTITRKVQEKYDAAMDKKAEEIVKKALTFDQAFDAAGLDVERIVQVIVENVNKKDIEPEFVYSDPQTDPETGRLGKVQVATKYVGITAADRLKYLDCAIKLRNMYPPVRREITGKDGGTIKFESRYENMSDEELREEIEKLTKIVEVGV